MSAAQADLLVEEARAFVGAPAAAAHRARDPVNQPMIHHWCQAFDDDNPAYLEADRAASSRHGGIVAPPAMLGSWTLDTVERRDGGPRDQVLRRLEEAGYTAVVATNYEQVYHREVRPGDVLSEAISVEALSERKTTALGEGYFVTVRHDYTVADGEPVGTARMRLLKFKPPPPRPAEPEAPSAPSRARPVITQDNAFFWEGVAAGELRIQHCTTCDRLRHPPRPMCADCGSTAWDTVASRRRGRVYSYAIHHHPPLPGVETPHVIVLVELDEGVRFLSHLASDATGAFEIGEPVEVVFEEIDEQLTLPVVRSIRGGRP